MASRTDHAATSTTYVRQQRIDQGNVMRACATGSPLPASVFMRSTRAPFRRQALPNVYASPGEDKPGVEVLDAPGGGGWKIGVAAVGPAMARPPAFA